jgi:hypothetical protein
MVTDELLRLADCMKAQFRFRTPIVLQNSPEELGATARLNYPASVSHLEAAFNPQPIAIAEGTWLRAC